MSRPLTRDPRRHHWRLWDEWRRLQEAGRVLADRTIRAIGGAIILIMAILVLLAGLGFLIKTLAYRF